MAALNSYEFTGAVGILILCIYFFFKRNHTYWQIRSVKQVTPSFLFGNVGPCVLAKETPVNLIHRVYKAGEGQKMIGFYAFDQPFLLLRDPELIKQVFIKDFDNFTDKIMTGNDGDVFAASNVFLAKDPPWRHIRHKLTPIFTTGKLKNMFELMLEISKDFHTYMDSLNINDKVGSPVEIREICGMLMTDLIGTTAFGLKLNSLTDPNAEFRKHGREMFRSGYKRYLEFLSIILIPRLRPFMRAKFFDERGTDFLRKSFWNVINERIKTGIYRPDLIDLLINIKKEQESSGFDGYKLEGDALVSQAAVFFSGGFETSSLVTSMGLYELARHKDYQSRLREEILTGMEQNDGKVTYDMLTTLPYLDMVVHETMRLYPSLNYLDRLAKKRYAFPGANVTIDSGIPVILPMNALHRDPKYFPDPDKFDPERFSEENKKNITPCTYFPFGEGPRKCIGGRLGLMQVKLGLICFLSKYEISFCDKTQDPIEMDNLWIVSRPKGDLILNLRKISS